jgi:hypothetical protein
MAIQNFIAAVWSAQLLFDFRQQSLAAALANREYEGEARRGNQVKITSGVPVAVKDYKAAGRTTTPDPLADTGQTLNIDQEKNFDFYVDDIDRAQAAGSLEGYTSEAGLSLAEDADTFLWATAAAGADAANKLTGGGTAPATGDDAFDIINDMGKALNKRKVPKARRVLAVNAEFESLLTQANSRLTSVDTSGTPEGLREATLGRLLGFTIVSSENLPETDEPMALGFYQPALAYVSQITETEAMRAENKFADRLRGLHVYGGKVIRPKAVATWTVGTAGA